jgi:hypothetical protein
MPDFAGVWGDRVVARKRARTGHIEHFMLLVPMASYPAVEIWLETSAAGISRPASDTQYSGRNKTFSRPRVTRSPSTVSARLLMNLMIGLARR